MQSSIEPNWIALTIYNWLVPILLSTFFLHNYRNMVYQKCIVWFILTDSMKRPSTVDAYCLIIELILNLCYFFIYTYNQVAALVHTLAHC